MDPITAAVIAVLPALAADTVKTGIKDAYDGLREVIKRRWGDSAPISKAISAVEKHPTSEAHALILEEKVAAANAAEDREVLKALQKLLDQMKEHGVGGDTASKIQLTITGGAQQGVIGAGTVNLNSQIFGVPPKS